MNADKRADSLVEALVRERCLVAPDRETRATDDDLDDVINRIERWRAIHDPAALDVIPRLIVDCWSITSDLSKEILDFVAGVSRRLI